MYEQDHKRVQFCHKKISRLTYGKDGLVSFLFNLFTWFEPADMAKAVSYSFALREQVEQMEAFERARRRERDIDKISEESNEDEEEKQALDMDFGTQPKELQRSNEKQSDNSSLK